MSVICEVVWEATTIDLKGLRALVCRKPGEQIAEDIHAQIQCRLDSMEDEIKHLHLDNVVHTSPSQLHPHSPPIPAQPRAHAAYMSQTSTQFSPGSPHLGGSINADALSSPAKYIPRRRKLQLTDGDHTTSAALLWRSMHDEEELQNDASHYTAVRKV